MNENWTKTILGFCSSSSDAAQKRSQRFCEHGTDAAISEKD